MPFDPKLFQIVAVSLVKKGSPEEILRTSCGRAYYSAFLYARERLHAIGQRIPPAQPGKPRPSVHQWVRDTLATALDGGIRGLGQQLGDMFHDRTVADCDLLPPYKNRQKGFSEFHTTAMAIEAKTWVEALDKVSDASLRAALASTTMPAAPATVAPPAAAPPIPTPPPPSGTS